MVLVKGLIQLMMHQYTQQCRFCQINQSVTELSSDNEAFMSCTTITDLKCHRLIYIRNKKSGCVTFLKSDDTV